ncbi:hypothetical protein EVAR_6405_1 [Eumeta japonica]|uniref:Uncharacterized protein n=1 Tax=Eumeta variegata TaxID=151549 RepID=A0A4C1TCI2_EUMVA|nr:hypothetical protein EVAR_6405_1 [Eumeta japonica]
MAKPPPEILGFLQVKKAPQKTSHRMQMQPTMPTLGTEEGYHPAKAHTALAVIRLQYLDKTQFKRTVTAMTSPGTALDLIWRCGT